jgi:uridylate kinase
MKKDSMVLKVGGSIFYDQLLNINFDFLKKLKIWYHENKDKYERIMFVTGGGGLSRNIQKKVADNIGGDKYLHDIAMSLTQTNATIFASFLEDESIYSTKKLGDAYEFLQNGEGNMVTGGLKVGWSTDTVAAVFADVINCDRVHKISNIENVYNKDPKEHFGAKPYLDMTWDQYFKLFKIVKGEQHKPNGSLPVDALCSQFCAKKGLSFLVGGGRNLDLEISIKEIIEKGTFIHP